MATAESSPALSGQSVEAMLVDNLLPIVSSVEENEVEVPDLVAADQPNCKSSQNYATSIDTRLTPTLETGSDPRPKTKKTKSKPSGNRMRNSQKPVDWSKLLQKHGRGNG